MSRRNHLLATLVALASAAPAVAIPSGPAPHDGPAGFLNPPPAWIETTTGDHWLAARDWEWCGGDPLVCTVVPQAAPALDACRARLFPTAPAVAVAPGERVRLHLGFAPTGVAVAFGARTETLDAGTDVAWTVSASTNLLRLEATPPGRGRVAYVARLVVGADRAVPRVRSGIVTLAGGRVRLALRVSEPVRVAVRIQGSRTRTRPRNISGRAPSIDLPAGETALDLGRLAPGDYAVFLRVRDPTGNTTSATRSFRVDRSGITHIGVPID